MVRQEFTRSGQLQERVYRCLICDVDHLKERLSNGATMMTESLIELSISGGSDYEGVSMRMEGTFDINCKRWDCYHFVG